VKRAREVSGERRKRVMEKERRDGDGELNINWLVGRNQK
jgi:hypothetical protein